MPMVLTNLARGTATSTAIVAHADAAAFRKHALAATATALHSAPCSIRAKTPGRNEKTDTPSSSVGA